MTQEPLAPCAHCGGTASQENYITEAVVRCTDCGATVTRRHAPEWDSGVPASIAAWNRRSTPKGRVTREEVALLACQFMNDSRLDWPLEKCREQLSAITKPHSGDCTKQPWTCLRCVAEESYGFADTILAMISAAPAPLRSDEAP